MVQYRGIRAAAAIHAGQHAGDGAARTVQPDDGLSFFKNFGLGDTANLQFRWEVYNLTNTPNFVNPNSQLGNPAFGQISSTGNSIPRQMQFAAKLIF